MTLGEKLKSIRRACGISQEAIGTQGFVSTPGYIKLENGQRLPSDKLVESLVNWLTTDKHVRPGAAKGLREELLTLKYLGSRSTFVQAMAKAHAKTLPGGEALLAPASADHKPRRGRPKTATSM